jgi:hypothetical protein
MHAGSGYALGIKLGAESPKERPISDRLMSLSVPSAGIPRQNVCTLMWRQERQYVITARKAIGDRVYGIVSGVSSASADSLSY